MGGSRVFRAVWENTPLIYQNLRVSGHKSWALHSRFDCIPGANHPCTSTTLAAAAAQGGVALYGSMLHVYDGHRHVAHTHRACVTACALPACLSVALALLQDGCAVLHEGRASCAMEIDPQPVVHMCAPGHRTGSSGLSTSCAHAWHCSSDIRTICLRGRARAFARHFPLHHSCRSFFNAQLPLRRLFIAN